MKILGERNTANRFVISWVEEMARLCKPDQVFWCDGSEGERQALTEQAVNQGILLELNQEKLPGCYYHRSNPNDVARVEQCTFICTENEEDAGPTIIGVGQRRCRKSSMACATEPCGDGPCMWCRF